MNMLIDHADIDIIKSICETYPVDGVTTNPTILARTKRRPYEVLKEIREFLPTGAQLHVQVVSIKADDMINEAHHIQAVLGEHTYIKIPVIPEGLKAIKALKQEGANITGTIVLTPMQGYLAAKAGADYVAPYVNRIDKYGMNGIQMVKNMHDMFQKNNFKTGILGASFKNVQQIVELAQYGVASCTLAPDVIEQFLCFDPVDIQVTKFVNDFESLYGKHQTMIEEILYEIHK